MVIYPEGIWSSCRTTEDIDEVLQTHLIDGGRVPRLMLRPGDTTPPAGTAPDALDEAEKTK
jgi:(2Fe-2S) ferredoxin